MYLFEQLKKVSVSHVAWNPLEKKVQKFINRKLFKDEMTLKWLTDFEFKITTCQNFLLKNFNSNLDSTLASVVKFNQTEFDWDSNSKTL